MNASKWCLCSIGVCVIKGWKADYNFIRQHLRKANSHIESYRGNCVAARRTTRIEIPAMFTRCWCPFVLYEQRASCTWCAHRYLMSRLSLKVVYLWRHVSSTAPPFKLWWSNVEILLGPLHRSSPFIGELSCQAIQTEPGPHIAERTQKAVYNVRCLWVCMVHSRRCLISNPLYASCLLTFPLIMSLQD
jgi:hypothetical protein